MTIVDYKKETGKFTIHIFDTLAKAHIEFLKKFKPSKSYNRVEFSVDELFKPTDDNEWRESRKIFWDLTNWGFLEDIYDHHDNKQVSRLTDLGKVLLDKIDDYS